jgi:deazaflavin-dependent oxidoreductase (nitroreductase family)
LPLPRALARFNRYVTNPLLGRLAPHLPGFALMVHTGRKSGRQYRTPVNVFHRGNRYVIALTYGLDADWVRNVQAAGKCSLQTRGRVLHLTHPHFVHGDHRLAVPLPVRGILRLIGVSDFLELEENPGDFVAPGLV